MVIIGMTITPVLCLITSSWLVIWILLEINTMSFCTLTAIMYKKNKKMSSEISIKYLIIQSVASAILVLYMSSDSKDPFTKILFFGGTFAVFLKLASVPFHSWFISIMKKSSWGPAMALMTLQKMAPVYLMTFLLSHMVTLSIMMTALLGSVSQLNKKKIMEILALSSIFNMSWTMTAMTLSPSTLLTFILLYWLSLALMMAAIAMNDTKSTSKEMFQKYKEWTLMMILASLAGLPPSMGFLAKWMVLNEMLKNSMLTITTILLTLSAINLFVYLRLGTTILLKMNQTKQKTITPSKKGLTLLMMIMNLPAIMMVSYEPNL